MTHPPAYALSSSRRLVLLLVLTAAMVVAFVCVIAAFQPVGLGSPVDPIPAPAVGLDL